jgi:hypothetical protein
VVSCTQSQALAAVTRLSQILEERSIIHKASGNSYRFACAFAGRIVQAVDVSRYGIYQVTLTASGAGRGTTSDQRSMYPL